MKRLESIQAERELLDPSNLENNICLLNDIMDFIIENALDDSRPEAEEKAYDRLELIYCTMRLRNNFAKILKTRSHE